MPDPTESALLRIADALERLSPPAPPAAAPTGADVLVWEPAERRLRPAERLRRVPIHLLQGIDAARDTLLVNTRRFAERLPANSALLWGTRGMGKSSLVKAVHAEVAAEGLGDLSLVEIYREDMASLACRAGAAGLMSGGPQLSPIPSCSAAHTSR